jgi:hypothetical protein
MVQYIERRGMHLLHRISWYHTMIDMPAWRFMLIILSFYVGINLFCQLYYGIGIEHLDGITGSDGEDGSNSDRPIFLVPKPLLLVMDTSALQFFDQFTLFRPRLLSVY